MSIAEFLARFEKPTKSGAGWQVHCPTHKDGTASLSVSNGGGKILVHCHAGCSTEQIVAALGLRMADLFSEPKPVLPGGIPVSFKGSPVVACYEYRDGDGNLSYRVLRTASKEFPQQRLTDSGEWVWKGPEKKLLYRLPELLAVDSDLPIFVVEGEKDVDNLRRLGCLATCNSGGAGKFAQDNSALKGRPIAILIDNDEAGWKHGEDVARKLQGTAASVRLIKLPDLPDKGDVSDWIAAGGTKEQLFALVGKTPEWEPIVQAPAAVIEKAASPETKIRASRMSDVRALPVSWVWRNRIPLHAITIIEGIEGVGKSTALTALVAAITTDRALPGDDRTSPQNVLWLSAEDDLARVLKPRLLSAEADCERIYAVGEPFRFDQVGVLALRELVAEHQPQVVIIDPIFAYTQGDASKGNDARALTGQLKMIAEQFEVAIVLVRHIGKAKGMGDPRAAGLYSIEWRAAARSVLLVGADPDNPAKCAITQTKNNLGPKAEGLGYSITSDPNSPSGARFSWTGVSDLTAERMLSQIGNMEEAQERNDAIDYLRELLQDGPLDANEVFKAADKMGISKYAVKAAKTKLRLVSKKVGGHFGGTRQKWEWHLPEEAEGVAEEPEEVVVSGNRLLQSNDSGKSSYANGLAEGVESKKERPLQFPSAPSEARVRGTI